MHLQRVFFLLIILAMGFNVSYAAIKYNEDDLFRALMTNYNKKSLPSTNTTVSLGFTILHIEVNEKKHSITLNLWTKMRWYDPRLTWNSTLYPNKIIILSRDDVWHPDIALYNNAEAKNFDHFVDVPIHVTNGTVLSIPPGTIDAQCVIDTTFWPHDVQNCTAKFGSWVHSGVRMNIVKSDVPIDTDHLLDEETQLLKFSEWKLLDLSLRREEKFYECCPEPYVSMLIEISLERYAPAYYWLVQIPCIGMSLLTIVVFLLSPSSSGKIMLGGVGLLINLFFLFAAKDMIGNSPNHTPLIIKLIVNQFLLILTSLIVSGLVLRMARDPHTRGVPNFMKGPLLMASAFLCLDGYRHSVSQQGCLKQEESLMAEGEFPAGQKFLLDCGKADKNEWILLAAFIDRIFLIIYVFIFFVNMIYFAGVL